MKKIDLVISSDRNEIRKFESRLEEINGAINLPPEKFINFQIACSEALVNAIVHGNNESPDKKVFMTIEYDETSIKIKIRDEGSGFNIESLPDPTSSENLLKESGRGIFIIRSLVDEFKCSSSGDGTEFTLCINK